MDLMISLPQNASCLIKIGETVDFGTPFFEGKQSEDVTIPLAKKMGVPPSKIFNFLKKFVGDTIKKGDTLASKKGLLSTYSYVSEHDGIIREVNHNDGSIIISALADAQSQYKTYFKGEIADIKKDHLTLKVRDVHSFDLKNITSNFGGPVFYALKQDQSLSSSELVNKIMVTESISPYLRTKSEALGIEGFVSLKNADVESIPSHAQIKHSEDFKKIVDLKFPYCVIDKEYSKISLYQ